MLYEKIMTNKENYRHVSNKIWNHVIINLKRIIMTEKSTADL